jgi:hypothetical protein
MVLWYRVKAAMLRREARRPCNFRARSVLLYDASRYEALADDARFNAAVHPSADRRKPTVH